MRWSISTGLPALMAALWLGGCASYKAAPFESERHAQAWDGRAKAMGQATDAALSLAGAERVALLFNADLRLARAEVGVQSAGVEFAGLLEDPSLGMGAVGAGLGRRISGGPSPWLVDVGLSMTVPLSDRLQVEKKNAKQLFNAAEAQVLAQEAAVVRELRLAFARWQGADARAKAWAAQTTRLDALHRRLDALVKAGTVPAFEADGVAFSLTEAGANTAQAEAEAAGERLRILALCGLRPQCPLQIGAGSAGLKTRAPGAAPHPARLAAQAAFDAAESALQLEVARSRPELSFGPTANRADGETTLGIGLGLTLPVWNRNQQAIAQATAARESARIGLEQAIESLAHGQAQAEVNAKGAAARLAIINRDMKPLLDRQAASLDRLVALGEFDPLRLIVLLDRRVAWELSLAQARADAAQAEARLAYFISPLPLHCEAVPVLGQGCNPWDPKDATHHPEGVAQN